MSTNMCNAVRQITERERAVGMRQGIEKGIEKASVIYVDKLSSCQKISTEAACKVLGISFQDYCRAKEHLELDK